MIDETRLNRIAASEFTQETPEIVTQIAAELLAARQHIAQLTQQLATEITLPYTSASPVCDIEAGYAAGVNDSKEAIRRAGFLIAGDD